MTWTVVSPYIILTDGVNMILQTSDSLPVPVGDITKETDQATAQPPADLLLAVPQPGTEPGLQLGHLHHDELQLEDHSVQTGAHAEDRLNGDSHVIFVDNLPTTRSRLSVAAKAKAVSAAPATESASATGAAGDASSPGRKRGRSADDGESGPDNAALQVAEPPKSKKKKGAGRKRW